jgi:ABC-type amino acid transport substrate-binding protein
MSMHAKVSIKLSLGAAALWLSGWAVGAPLTVCVSQDNPPQSQVRAGQASGFDIRLARAVAEASAARTAWLAATPPATTRAVASGSIATAWRARSARTAATLAWKLAAMSSRRKPLATT